MIAGTPFVFADWSDEIERFLRAQLVDPGRCSIADLGEVAAQCRAGRALCLAHPFGLVIVELQTKDGRRYDLRIRLAAGFRPGAFQAAESALVAIAHDIGAETISFWPARRGWERLLGPAWVKRGDDFMRHVDGQVTGAPRDTPGDRPGGSGIGPTPGLPQALGAPGGQVAR